jgi:radical SAM superfamily enzyme YgiQ (UPF0313 family)
MRELYQRHGAYRYFDDGSAWAEERFRAKTSRVLEYLVRQFRPAVLGISVTHSIHHRAAEILLQLLRELAPGTPVLVGGNHATFTARHWLEHDPPCDVVVLGEGEDTCLRLLQ